MAPDTLGDGGQAACVGMPRGCRGACTWVGRARGGGATGAGRRPGGSADRRRRAHQARRLCRGCVHDQPAVSLRCGCRGDIDRRLGLRTMVPSRRGEAGRARRFSGHRSECRGAAAHRLCPRRGVPVPLAVVELADSRGAAHVVRGPATRTRERRASDHPTRPRTADRSRRCDRHHRSEFVGTTGAQRPARCRHASRKGVAARRRRRRRCVAGVER